MMLKIAESGPNGWYLVDGIKEIFYNRVPAANVRGDSDVDRWFHSEHDKHEVTDVYLCAVDFNNGTSALWAVGTMAYILNNNGDTIDKLVP